MNMFELTCGRYRYGKITYRQTRFSYQCHGGKNTGMPTPRSFFYGSASLLWYRGILAVATLLVTVAWTLVVPWSTHPELTPGTVSLNVLALMLLALVFATFIVGIALPLMGERGGGSVKGGTGWRYVGSSEGSIAFLGISPMLG